MSVLDELHTARLADFARVGHWILEHFPFLSINGHCRTLEGELQGVPIYFCNKPPPEPKAMLSANQPSWCILSSTSSIILRSMPSP